MNRRRRKTRKPTRRLDRSEWGDLLDDGKVHVARGIVVVDGGSHFAIVEGGADVLVEVELQPSLIRVSARLSGLGGGPRGFWAIPAAGAEVIVGMPDGEYEAGPVILACESTGHVPDGLSATTFVIVAPAGGQVLVHDGTASQAEKLAKLADVQTLRDEVNVMKSQYNGHTHLDPVSGSTGTPSLTMATPSQPSGTSTLKAK